MSKFCLIQIFFILAYVASYFLITQVQNLNTCWQSTDTFVVYTVKGFWPVIHRERQPHRGVCTLFLFVFYVPALS